MLHKTAPWCWRGGRLPMQLTATQAVSDFRRWQGRCKPCFSNQHCMPSAPCWCLNAATGKLSPRCFGKGALTAMEDIELRHWMRAATVRTALGSAHAARQALQAFGSAGRTYRRAVEVSP